MTYEKLIMVDGGDANSFTAKCSGAVSGGYLLKWGSGTDVVGSAAGDWDSATDTSVEECDDTAGLNCVGIAGFNAGSGTEVTVYMDGIYILPVGSNAASGGEPVVPSGYGNMIERLNTGSVAKTRYPIGRALSTGTALTGFAVVRLNI